MRRIITASLLGASLAAGLVTVVGCSDDTVEVAEYEDCDVEDQQKHETDCGYWQHPLGADVAVADRQFNNDWVWVWFPWVVLGQASHAPAYWTPPRGVKPPTRIVRVPKRKACSMTLITDVLVVPAPPRPPSIPKAPAPKAPVNNPPKVNQPAKPAKPYVPPKPGVRPAGC